MNLPDDFLNFRNCFRPPIPELRQAADLLSEAANALMEGDHDLARDRLHKADMPVVYDFADSIMGKEKREIHRRRPVMRPSAPAKVEKRRPAASVEAAIYARDGWHCRFCGIRVVLPEARRSIAKMLPDAARWSSISRECHAALYALSATIDHVLPHALGGDNDPNNLVTTCWPCNFGRGDWLLEEVGLNDPRKRDPIIDEWDGLRRVLRHAEAEPCSASISEHELLPPAPASIMSEDAWFSQLDRIGPGVSSRLRAFLEECEHLPITCRVKEVLVVRMDVNGVSVWPLGVYPNGDVEIPWFAGEQKRHFRSFAERIAEAVPGAEVYETPAMWRASKAGKKRISVMELLDTSASIRTALEELNVALMR